MNFKVEYDGKYIYPSDELSDYMKTIIGIRIYVDKIYEDETTVYGSLKDIPITMKKVFETWLILPSTNSYWGETCGISWEWYPHLNFININNSFWESIGEKKSDISNYNFYIDKIEDEKYYMKIHYFSNGNEKKILKIGTVTDWISPKKPWRIIEKDDIPKKIDEKMIIFTNTRHILENFSNENSKKDIINLCNEIMNLDILSQTRNEVSITEAQSKQRCMDFQKIRNIMIVDDIPLNRKILRRRLLSIDIFDIRKLVILDASDGQEAVNLFKTYSGKFDFILMDCIMPIMDGYDATKTIIEYCETENIKKVPIIAVTATIDEENKKKCHGCGMEFIIKKPCTIGEIVNAIKSCI